MILIKKRNKKRYSPWEKIEEKIEGGFNPRYLLEPNLFSRGSLEFFEKLKVNTGREDPLSLFLSLFLSLVDFAVSSCLRKGGKDRSL